MTELKETQLDEALNNNGPDREMIIKNGRQRYKIFYPEILKYLDTGSGETYAFDLYRRYCELGLGDTDIWGQELVNYQGTTFIDEDGTPNIGCLL